MADENLDYESLARNIGWAPKDEYKGSSGEWMDAESFYKKSQEVLPILRATNRDLHNRLASTQTEIETLKRDLRAANASVKTILETQEEDLKERTEAIRKSLLAEKKAALKDEDHDRVVDIDEELRAIDKAATKGGKGEQKSPPADDGRPQLPAETIAATNSWIEANPWYQTDREKAAVSHGLASAIRAEMPHLINAAFYAELDKRLGKLYPTQRPRGESKVNGGGNGGENSTQSGDGQSYADLPAEAKAACQRQAKHVVGADRKHKDLKSWQAAYAKTYFES